MYMLKMLKKIIFKSTSVEEKSVEEKSVEEKPVEEKPVEEKSVEEKPVEEKPLEEKPVEEKPVEEKPVEGKSAEEKPVEEKLGEENKKRETIDYRYFHDATIHDMVIQYEEHKITFNLSGYMHPLKRGYDHMELIFKEFNKVNLTRFDDWGLRDYYCILNIQETLLSNNFKEYKIQLTSGDVIEIHCESYEIKNEIWYDPKRSGN
jgi:hypothetical protein